MNAEKLYNLACDSLRLACIAECDNNKSDGEVLYNNVTKDPETWAKNPYWVRYVPALEIYMMAKDELGKAKHGSAYSAMKRIVAGVADHRKDLQGVWTDAEGRQCACDGYRAVRLEKPVEGFESVMGMDLSGPFKVNLGEELHVPTPGEIKTGKKRLATGRAVYDFGDGFPMVSAAYLKDIIDILPGARAYATGGQNSLIYFKSDRGDAILMPVRKSAC